MNKKEWTSPIIYLVSRWHVNLLFCRHNDMDSCMEFSVSEAVLGFVTLRWRAYGCRYRDQVLWKTSPIPLISGSLVFGLVRVWHLPSFATSNDWTSRRSWRMKDSFLSLGMIKLIIRIQAPPKKTTPAFTWFQNFTKNKNWKNWFDFSKIEISKQTRSTPLGKNQVNQPNEFFSRFRYTKRSSTSTRSLNQQRLKTFTSSSTVEFSKSWHVFST